MTDMTRRDLVASLAAMIAGLLLPGASAADQTADDWPSGWLDAVVPDLAAAGRLGRAYLAAHPDEREPRRLVVELLGSLGLSKERHAVDSVPAARWSTRAREVVTEDYLAGRVVPVDGWVLSVTEARLYALAALADRPLQ